MREYIRMHMCSYIRTYVVRVYACMYICMQTCTLLQASFLDKRKWDTLAMANI